MAGRREPQSLRTAWQRMPGWQRAGVAVLLPIEVVATTVAAIDLVRRPRSQVRGPKLLWWPALTVQPFGPLAYLVVGRRPPVSRP